MPDVIDVAMESGEIVFRKAEGASPARAETRGNLTYNYAESPGRSAYYEVSFPLSVTLQDGDVRSENFWTVRFVSQVERIDAPYLEVESAAARQIAPILRAVADRIEEAVAKFDGELAEKAP